MKIFEWLKLQFLESRACEGLIILLLSVQTKNSNSKILITDRNLGDLLKVRCMATDLITGAIGNVLDIPFQYTLYAYVSMSFRNVSRSKAEFEDLVGNNLPLIYLNYIEELQEDNPYEVWSCWNTLFDDYCNEHELKYTRDDERYLRDFNKAMIGRATIFAEILRSTFFKLLDYLHFEGKIKVQDLFRYTVANFTIEPSVWSLNLGTKPTWWPKLKGYPKLKYDEQPPELDIDIKKLLYSIKNSQLLSLNAILPHTDYFYHSDYFYGLEILPFAFYGNWNRQIEPSFLFHELEMNSGIWYPEVGNMRNFGVFSNKLKFYNSKGSMTLNGLEVIPLVAAVRSLNTNMFQYYRSFYRCKLLTPIIKDELDLRIDYNRLSYFKEGNTFGYYQDFLDGLRDASDTPELLPYNTFLLLDRVYLLDFLKKNNMNLAYAVKKTLYTKNR